MIAGFLVLGLLAALGSSAIALILGYSFWIALLAYMLGGTLGGMLAMGAGVVRRFLCAQIRGLHCAMQSQGHQYQH
jgi:hypothetical protein